LPGTLQTKGLHAASTGITRHVCFTKLNVPAKDLAPEGVERNKTLVSEADLPEGFIPPPQRCPFARILCLAVKTCCDLTELGSMH